MRAVQVCGEQILVVRRDDGGLRALRDRCPHRGMALTKGTLQDGRITCPFHGWQFTTEGACAAIPALSRVESTDVTKIRIRAFDVVERFGMVWIKPGDKGGTSPPLPDVDFEPVGPPLAVSVEVEASFDLSVLSLVDPAHVAYVHDNSWWWRTSKVAREKIKQFEPSPYGFTMRSHQAARAAFVYRLLGGVPDVEIEFRLPGVRLERDLRRTAPVCELHVRDARRQSQGDPDECDVLELAFAERRSSCHATPGRGNSLNQDRDVLQIAQKGLDRQPSMILLGECDLPGQWYFGLKREFLRSFGRRGAPLSIRSRPRETPLAQLMLRPKRSWTRPRAREPGLAR